MLSSSNQLSNCSPVILSITAPTSSLDNIDSWLWFKASSLTFFVLVSNAPSQMLQPVPAAKQQSFFLNLFPPLEFPQSSLPSFATLPLYGIVVSFVAVTNTLANLYTSCNLVLPNVSTLLPVPNLLLPALFCLLA